MMAEEVDGHDDALPSVAIVRDYAEGRASVEDVLDVCRSYKGPNPHFLLSPFNENDDFAFLAGDISVVVFVECLRIVPEDDLVALLEAVVAEWPQVHTLHTGRGSNFLLHLALEYTESRRIHMLLAVPEAARLSDPPSKQTPLHVALSRARDVHPDVIRHLIDLDPDVLTMTDFMLSVPLHEAFLYDPTGEHVKRMIELRPETLLHHDLSGMTPVAAAVCTNLRDPLPAAEALRLVDLYPASFAPTSAWFIPMAMSPLIMTCTHHANHPELVMAVLHASPTSLVIPHHQETRALPLPFTEVEARGGNDDLVESVWKETVRMTLSVIEYGLGMDVAALARGANSDMSTDCATNLAWFQGHVKEALQEHVPEVPVGGESGLLVAQNVLQWSCGNNSNEAMTALILALFCHDRARKLLCDEARVLRNALLSETVVDLYRLNCRGRYRPNVAEGPPSRHVANEHGDDDDDDDSRSVTADAAMHQIELLASLRDSISVESTYLQFREVAYYPLLVRQRE